MKVTLSMVVLVACLAIPGLQARAEDSSEIFEHARIKLSADEKPQYVLAQLHADSEMQNVRFRFDNEPWQPTIADPADSVIYTMKHSRACFSGRRVLVSAQDPTTEQWIVISGEINKEQQFEEQDRQIVETGDKALSNVISKILSENASGQGGYQGEFLALVNSYRARMGRGPLSYDGSLESIAARNNQSGGYHNYTGGTPQVWAMGSGSASGTLRQWQNSPPHNNILLGGYSRVGIAHDGRNWTANFR